MKIIDERETGGGEGGGVGGGGRRSYSQRVRAK